MKVTVNSSIPEQLRPQVEVLVRSFAAHAEIIWLPSRFPRLVMLVEPDGDGPVEEQSGSIFESPTSGTLALSSVTAYLESEIQALVATWNDWAT